VCGPEFQVMAARPVLGRLLDVAPPAGVEYFADAD